MVLKLYYDFLSQPSRALYIFLKKCQIPFEQHFINLKKGEQFSTEYQEIHPFQKIPAIDHDGFKLIESVAILRYLCREFNINNHWYPSASKERARVDEYLEWQHMNTRLHCAGYFLLKVCKFILLYYNSNRGENINCLSTQQFIRPIILKKPASPDKLAAFHARMVNSLDLLETVWLKDKPFLTSDKISIADLIGACEVEQMRIIGYNPSEGRPLLMAWLERVKNETHPFYEEVHKPIDDLARKFAEQSSATRSML
ncbi:glutathione S-transferase theta-1 isoform X2 [Orussus abietinus]|nr:glutathione S-transferase theta-1 isoform X2 [Orussus abietinus]XP_023290832.1 glutathione S-transferase theta-1 isoform X2 [Orussus abietinus]XP_023290834.1 glutathione S-transferase theta-1 isoform X2 [Orussus abietinus]XP_023290840.1 glutathione S-transferase theta-1 isoform X2 [Orussus abietinus]XP_023290842.1 glutathione S-transferase theta-1 isoform X2 [Orussus abietinus]